jgi:hypothetical protein
MTLPGKSNCEERAADITLTNYINRCKGMATVLESSLYVCIVRVLWNEVEKQGVLKQRGGTEAQQQLHRALMTWSYMGYYLNSCLLAITKQSEGSNQALLRI